RVTPPASELTNAASNCPDALFDTPFATSTWRSNSWMFGSFVSVDRTASTKVNRAGTTTELVCGASAQTPLAAKSAGIQATTTQQIGRLQRRICSANSSSVPFITNESQPRDLAISQLSVSRFNIR